MDRTYRAPAGVRVGALYHVPCGCGSSDGICAKLAVGSKRWSRSKAVGAGPFLLDEWIRDNRMTMSRNPDWNASPGPYLDKLMKQTGVVTTTLDYKVSSGLSRPDFFDWPTYFAQRIPAVNPDIVVVTFGGNDAQGLRNLDKTWAVQHSPGGTGDDADWRAEYGKRVGAAMDYLFVELLGEQVHARLPAAAPQVQLRQRLVREGVAHHERRMPGRAGEVH